MKIKNKKESRILLNAIEIKKLCKWMRAIDVMNKNKALLQEDKELQKEYKSLRKKTRKIFEILTEKQVNLILDIHSSEIKRIEKKELEEKTNFVSV